MDEQTLQITGAAYRLAAPVHSPEPVDFGIVHVGDVVTQAVSISNTATNDGFSERLNGSIGSPTTGITTNSGAFSGLVPGDTNSTSLSVGVDTATAGAKSGTATIELVSSGAGTSGLANTALASQTVNVLATVNNFAVADVVKTGGVGTLTPTGAHEFTLNLGSTFEGRGSLTAQLGVVNDVAAPADSLAGSFTLAAPAFDLSGFTPFSNLAAGATQGGLMVTLGSTTTGSFAGQITLAPQSTNPRPFSMDLPTVTINLTGVVHRQGDYNFDGHVDGRDFLVWQRGASPDPLSAADLADWQAAYGTAPLVATQLAVPEPGSVLLLLVGLAALTSYRRKQVRSGQPSERLRSVSRVHSSDCNSHGY